MNSTNNFIEFTFSVVSISDVIVRSIAYVDVPAFSFSYLYNRLSNTEAR